MKRTNFHSKPKPPNNQTVDRNTLFSKLSTKSQEKSKHPKHKRDQNSSSAVEMDLRAKLNSNRQRYDRSALETLF